jgi:hypothetical protein
VRLGFTEDAAKYFTRDADLSSLDEVAYLDGDDDVDNLIKRLNHPGGTTTSGNGIISVTSPNSGYGVSIRSESNLNMCVFYLNHQEIVYHHPTVDLINLSLVRGFRDQQKWKDNFKKTVVEPMINDKDWSRTLENIQEYMVSIFGTTVVTFAYVMSIDS